MVSNNAARTASDIFAMTTSTLAHDDTLEDAPPTKRLSAVDLARALAAMELYEDEDRDKDVRCPEGHPMKCAIAPRPDRPLRPSTDDEPTLDVPAPPIPPGVRSPLGDDGDATSPAPESAGAAWEPDETLTLHELGLELDDELTFLPSSCEVTRPDVEGRREDPDARRARRSVVASWILAAATSALCTYLVATAGRWSTL